MMRLIMRMLRSRGAGGGDFAYHFLLSLFVGFVVEVTSCEILGESEAFHTGTDGLDWG